jgi:hypothetical protein
MMSLFPFDKSITFDLYSNNVFLTIFVFFKSCVVLFGTMMNVMHVKQKMWTQKVCHNNIKILKNLNPSSNEEFKNKIY